MYKAIERVGCLIVIAVLIQSCSHGAKSNESPKTLVPEVEITNVQEKTPSRQVVLPGELKPWNKVDILARVRGYVGGIHVDRGSMVKKGQVLTVLEAPEVVAELGNAQAQYETAKAGVIEQEARLRSSKLTYNRLMVTSKTPGAVSANEIDMAYARMMVDSAATVSREGLLEAARAKLVSQRQLVKYLTVRAPFNGIITARNVSPGTLVGSGGNQGLPMFVLEDRSRLRLTVAIPERMTNAIPKDSEVSFVVAANPGDSFVGHYARSANSLEEMNRSMLTEFDVDNKSGELKSGMYAEVTLPLVRNEATLFVPASALVHTSEGVYVIKTVGNTAEWVSVEKGNQIEDLVEVFGAIEAKQNILLVGNPEIRNGQRVNIAPSKS
ncbi:efflux RND transporter periplasmic adaptor subunit [Reichenbachiella carrageenanivorans]|uniref:Efflux RND transporter periplasmic adaptor subunit n=1 Tax=Reichenbachiella carrageenanivorans TaxID=2979869 RepID=A0ABY6CX24_9BACT|nr:efflux RND transporter periplasmic adaptor subunit [Reichenbachiella carrageenanivorans]UXX78476.1 efflux RND transporter periplasmic adaptor subunit [Reichenbachiella carrageenanivorans]